jgi:hypothetical protein
MWKSKEIDGVKCHDKGQSLWVVSQSKRIILLIWPFMRERERDREHSSICAYILCSKFILKFHTIYLKPELHPHNYLEAIRVCWWWPPSLQYSFDLMVNGACDWLHSATFLVGWKGHIPPSSTHVHPIGCTFSFIHHMFIHLETYPSLIQTCSSNWVHILFHP